LVNLFNTLSSEVEPFILSEDRKVKMYTCGPSTYLRPHIGNYRTFLFEDILQRYLEYLGYEVTRLITLTDIEDKAIAEAEKEHISVEELTKRNEDLFFEDFELLRIERPDFAIRASTSVNQSVKLIKTLLMKGYAYTYTHDDEENVYYDPLKFEGFGKLAKIDMDKWPKQKRRFHKDTYPGTPWNKGDFILWHGCKQGSVCWKTEIGQGRPAWNIQDAAIVTSHLGFTVDVACGGADNLVRHHDYTIAVTEAASGKQFSRYWLHGAHLFVDGKKMSKSKGNVYYPKDLLSKGYKEYHIRFFLIYSHYRKRLNFTWEKLAKVSKKIDSIKRIVAKLQKVELENPSERADNLAESIVDSFEIHMDNDLNLRNALNDVCKILSKFEKLMTEGKLGAKDASKTMKSLRKIDEVLQVIF
jgi:cysteinyl-tRNA synthetase